MIGNFGDMIKQAQQLQTKLDEMKSRLEKTEYEGKSGGGMVSITLNGKNEVKKIKLDPSIVSADEVEILEDLIIAAFNDAKAKADAGAEKAMEDATGGFPLPSGFKLPF